jgi:hypothetical protein
MASSEDAEPSTRLLETAVASPGSFVRIPRGLYRFDRFGTEVTVCGPGFVEAAAENLRDGDATSGSELHLAEESWRVVLAGGFAGFCELTCSTSPPGTTLVLAVKTLTP